VGIHSGIACVGNVTTHSDISDVSILGDTVNIAARLASHASGGEIIISEESAWELIFLQTAWNPSGLF
jgi:class 3 adenylate cyclase